MKCEYCEATLSKPLFFRDTLSIELQVGIVDYHSLKVKNDVLHAKNVSFNHFCVANVAEFRYHIINLSLLQKVKFQDGFSLLKQKLVVLDDSWHQSVSHP